MRVSAVTPALILLWIVPAAGASPSYAAADPPGQGISDSTWVDHDGRPIPQPPDWEPGYWGHEFREGFVEPLSHLFDVPDILLGVTQVVGADPEREAVNVNAFDEVPNSTWFTNRNHVRSVPVAELCQGPDSVFLPAKPWIIKHAKQGGRSAGFQIKDAEGKKWLVKLDPLGYPQLSSGSDMIARTLLHAAGYNVSHNEPVQFQRSDLTIDEDLRQGKEETPFTESDLDTLLSRGAVQSDGSYSAYASLFLPGHALGAPSTRRLRPGDSNDWYAHINRRELRGLYVLSSWVGSWDTKDHQFLDMYVEARDSLGYVEHYILDVGGSFGATSTGPKPLIAGYENAFDLEWIGRRIVTLGFVQEPWRRARQETGIPSVGNFESTVYEPAQFKTQILQPAFREMTDRDGYWGAKIVASFSNAQIAAAVDAVHYEDSRAAPYLVQCLIERRDKIAQHWFDRVAPLDFFWVQDGALHFHDLAVDVGLAPPRVYEVETRSLEDGNSMGKKIRLSTTAVDLRDLGDVASGLSLELSIAGNRAKPTHVELRRKGSAWVITRVRHG
jgi:hypothetical protein